VDELGTGTLAFHSGCIDINPHKWEYINQADLMTMIDAIRQEVPRIAIRRKYGFLKPIAENQDDSIYRKSLVNDAAQTCLLQSCMEHYPDSWCMSE